MKSFKYRLAQVCILGAVLAVVTGGVDTLVQAQSAPIRGQSSAGVYENLVSDGAGHLITAPNANLTYSGGTVTVSAVQQTLVPANASRKVLIVQNNDAAVDFFVSFSPIVATSGIKLLHAGGIIKFDGDAPTTSLVFSGTGATSSAMVLEGY